MICFDMFFSCGNLFDKIPKEKSRQMIERGPNFDITPEERSTILVNLRRQSEERQKVSIQVFLANFSINYSQDIYKAIEAMQD